jgi:hypothetical protein
MKIIIYLANMSSKMKQKSDITFEFPDTLSFIFGNLCGNALSSYKSFSVFVYLRN